MKVTLINSAQEMFADNEKLGELSAAICVGKLDNPSRKGMLSALNSGHLSIIEHLPLTFLIEDVSRALTHQLVRHRIASYSQQSQRYVKINTKDKWYITPMSIDEHAFGSKYFHLMEDIAELYNDMCNSGVPNEDARMVLPNACFTSIIVSMNARSLVEQSSKRLCNRAQWEIKELYTKMTRLIKDVYPTVYDLCVPPCKTSVGCREKYPCHKHRLDAK